MQSPVIVESHPVQHSIPGLLPGGKFVPMQPGRFQVAPEAFSWRVDAPMSNSFPSAAAFFCDVTLHPQTRHLCAQTGQLHLLGSYSSRLIACAANPYLDTWRTQLLRLAFGIPSTLAVTAIDGPPLTWRTASNFEFLRVLPANLFA